MKRSFLNRIIALGTCLFLVSGCKGSKGLPIPDSDPIPPIQPQKKPQPNPAPSNPAPIPPETPPPPPPQKTSEDYAKKTTFILTTRNATPPLVGQASGVTKSGLVLITGGVPNNQKFSNQVEFFNTQRSTFEVGTGLQKPRFQHTMTSVTPDDCDFLIAGGGASPNTFEIYSACKRTDATRGSNVSIGNLKAKRTGHTATKLMDGRVLLAGGFELPGLFSVNEREDSGRTAEIYNPKTGTTEFTESMYAERSLHAALLLKDGTVLISGGYSENGGLKSLEIYDPISGTFELLGAELLDGRSSHTMNLLKDGTVLIAGGYSKENTAINTAEIYDPKTKKVSPTKPMIQARAAHGSVTLSDQTVLLVGGSTNYNGGISIQFNSNGTSLTSAEIYNPISNTFIEAPSMSKARSFPIVADILNSKVLVLGGMGSNESAKSAEVFEYSQILKD